MNPYARFLGNRDPIEVISETPGRLRALIDPLAVPDTEQAPAPGKWSIREIICHLADTELVFAFRLRQAKAESHHVIQPFDQERWAESYGSYDLAAALEMFSTARAWNAKFITSGPPDLLAKRLTHPERGEMTFQVLVETMAGHDLNHLRQIEGIAASR